MWPLKPKNWDDMTHLEKADWYWDSSEKWLIVSIIFALISLFCALIGAITG